MLLHLVHGRDRYYRMRVGTTGSHLGSDPDRLHNFLLGRAMLYRCFGMTLDAIRALRDVGGRDGDKLLCLGRQRAVGEYEFAERVERSLDVGSEFPTLAGEVLG